MSIPLRLAKSKELHRNKKPDTICKGLLIKIVLNIIEFFKFLF